MVALNVMRVGKVVGLAALGDAGEKVNWADGSRPAPTVSERPVVWERPALLVTVNRAAYEPGVP